MLNSAKNPRAALLCFAAVCFAAGPKDCLAAGPTLAEVIEAHDGAIGSIHSIDLTLKVRSVDDQKKKTYDNDWRWTKEGDNEKIAYLKQVPVEDGRANLHYMGIMVQNGRTRKRLENYDPNNPKPILPLDQGSVEAEIGPQDAKLYGWFIHPDVILGLKLELGTSGVSRALSEVIRENSGASMKQAQLDSRPVFQIILPSPLQKPKVKPQEKPAFFEVFVDPKINYMIRKIIVHANASNSGKSYVTSFDMSSFKDFGNGVFVPTSILFSMGQGDGSNLVPVWRGEVEVLSVNEKLPESAFELAFPANCQVIVRPPEGGKVVRQLWGPDDRPVFTFHNKRELKTFVASLEASRKAGAWRLYTIYSFLAITALFVLVVAVRKVGPRLKGGRN